MGGSWQNLWIRWVLVFLLISFGSALYVSGLENVWRYQNPLTSFLGYWIGQALYLVAPGAFVGAIVGLASSKPIYGGRVMIAINAILTILVFIGYVIVAQK